MHGRRGRLRLVIFDCDGVLVDSEPVSARVVAAELTALGWPTTPDEAHARFLGMTLTDMVPLIEQSLGRPVPFAWLEGLQQHLVEALSRQAEPVAGAVEALAAVSALGLPWRVASNSSHAEMRAKFHRLGLLSLVSGRTHSHQDVPRGKPAPDLFLAAAAAEGVAAAECVVIEDSLPGVRAAAAACMDCLAYAPHSDGAVLRAGGAVPFHSMFDVPALITAALRRTA